MSKEEGEALEQAAQEGETGSENVPETKIEPEVLKQYEGKSKEEILEMYVNAQKKIGEQGEHLGSLKKSMEDLKSEFSQMRRTQNAFESAGQGYQPKEEKTTPKEPEYPDDDLATYGSMKEYYRRERDKEQKEQRESRRHQAFAMATVAHEQGKKAAMQKYPKLFDGISEQVEQAIFSTFRPQAEQGNDVSQSLRDPETWRMTAEWLKLQNRDYDYFKSQDLTPVQPISTETPAAVKTQTQEKKTADTSFTNDRDMYQFIDVMESARGKKFTKEEIEELIKTGGAVVSQVGGNFTGWKGSKE